LGSATVGANNAVFDRRLNTAHEQMLEGDGIANPLAATGMFPNAAIQMITVGEQTGTLEVQLQNAAAFYSRELEYRLKKLTALFEPAVIIFMAMIVGFVAVALVSAMYGVFQTPQLQPPAG
jgi:type IV pilus assembly protein PilC